MSFCSGLLDSLPHESQQITFSVEAVGAVSVFVNTNIPSLGQEAEDRERFRQWQVKSSEQEKLAAMFLRLMHQLASIYSGFLFCRDYDLGFSTQRLKLGYRCRNCLFCLFMSEKIEHSKLAISKAYYETLK